MFEKEQNSATGVLTEGGNGDCQRKGVRMRLELEGQSPEVRAERYLDKAAETRRVMKSIRDPQVRASLKKLIGDWEYLARFTFRLRS